MRIPSTKPIISAVAAMSTNRVIGQNNQLPWHLPADLRYFRELTTGHPVIMGRKTYTAIGRPLPNRTNVIITRDPRLEAPGCTVVSSLAEAIEAGSRINNEEIFIIGGADIYRQSLPYLQRIYLTLVHAQIEGDVHFPPLDNHWRETERSDHPADEKNLYAYSFIRLERE